MPINSIIHAITHIRLLVISFTLCDGLINTSKVFLFQKEMNSYN